MAHKHPRPAYAILKEMVADGRKERRQSFNEVAVQLSVSPTYLRDILNGREPIDEAFLNNFYLNFVNVREEI